MLEDYYAAFIYLVLAFVTISAGASLYYTNRNNGKPVGLGIVFIIAGVIMGLIGLMILIYGKNTRIYVQTQNADGTHTLQPVSTETVIEA